MAAMRIRIAAVVGFAAFASMAEASDSPIDALMSAIEKADAKAVASMLDKAPDLVHQTDWRESLPLARAAMDGTPEIVALLLGRGAKVNAPGKSDGRTALSWAALSCKRPNAEALVRGGADLHLAGMRGWTPLHWAARNGCPKVIDYLITMRANVEARSKGGMTPAGLAAVEGQAGSLERLFAAGADPKTRMDDGAGLLHLVLVSDHLRAEGRLVLAKRLIQAGVPAAATATDGTSPLHIAAARGEVDLARTLLEAGATVSATVAEGLTSLHIASARCHPDMVRALIAAGADKSAKDNSGATAAAVATKVGCHDAERALSGAR